MKTVGGLKHRTGVGWGGITLYLLAVAAGVAVAGRYGTVDDFRGNPFIFLAGLVYALGLLGIVSAVSNAPRALRLAIDHRGGVGEGRTAVTGTVETTSGTLTSPFRGEPSVCYTYRVLKNDHDDEPDPEDESNWTLVARDDGGTAFALVTNRGERVRVDPADASIHVSDREEVAVGLDEEPPDSVRSFCREADIPSAAPDAARRYQESILAPGEEAFVWGHADSAGTLTIEQGSPFVVADTGYPSRIRERVTVGLLLGIPVTVVGLVALLVVAGVF